MSAGGVALMVPVLVIRILVVALVTGLAFIDVSTVLLGLGGPLSRDRRRRMPSIGGVVIVTIFCYCHLSDSVVRAIYSLLLHPIVGSIG